MRRNVLVEHSLLGGHECALAKRVHVIVSNLARHPDGRCIAAACARAIRGFSWFGTSSPRTRRRAVHAALGD